VNKLFPLALAALCLTAPASAQISAFQHIIIVIQENRSPDNLFQGLCTTPSACSTAPSSGQYNIQIPTVGWADKTSKTGTTIPHSIQFGIGYDLEHSHQAFVAMCDPDSTGACRMDGAVGVGCIPHAQKCPAKKAFAYVDNSSGVLNPYLTLATSYGWGNQFFHTQQGASLPAHQYLFGATSAPTEADDHQGTFESGNSGFHQISGCAAASGATVPVINSAGDEFERIFPCFHHHVLSDLLKPAGKTWRYYGNGSGSQWIAPNAIYHICTPVVNGQCTGKDWKKNVEPVPSAILSDTLTKCKLRDVSWAIPDGTNSDHSGFTYRTGGPSWVASIVNAVGQSTCKNPDGSSYWDSTAIIITWDEWGGWYDHVPPMIEKTPWGNFEMGFRVPLIVVSAYTSPGFISNTPADFGSVIRFVEQNFGIRAGSLTFADARGFASNLTEYFNLGSSPRTFTPISTPLSVQHFINTPPSGDPPDDD
jgi:phospholipase C